jgi:putative DNA primase/helicase
MPVFRHSDYENAERLIARHGADIRYCETWKRWLIWAGTHWQEDKTQAIVRLAKETVRNIYAEAANTIDPHDRKALIQHGVKSESSGRIAAMIALAESEPSVPVVPEALDLNNWLLPCPNGTIDLKTGQLISSSRDHLLTKLCPTKFDPNATAPTWELFLDKIFKGQIALIEFVQRAAGYSVTGEISERSLFILYGKGRNGKSTLLDTLSRVIGEEYSTTTTAELLIAKPGMQDIAMSAYLAELKGYRLVACSETEDGKRLAEAGVKHMTGNEKINAKRLYSQPFEYRPQFKVWLGTNHKPEIRGTDEGIWDRIKLIPFDVRISDADENKNLIHELIAEAEGILAWIVRGCLEWQKVGLSVPGDVTKATKNYRAEMDTFQAFIEDTLIVEESCRSRASALYETYKKWCEQTGEFCQKQRWVGQRLTDLGYQKSKGTNGMRFWDGLGIKTQVNDSEDNDLPF